MESSPPPRGPAGAGLMLRGPAGGHRLPGTGLTLRLPLAIALVQTIGTTLAARGQPESLDPLGYLLLAASGLALTARHRHRLPTFAVTGLLTGAYQLLDYPGGPTFVAVIIAGIGAVKAGHRYPVWVLTAAGYGAWLAIERPTLAQAAILAAWLVGLLLVAEWARGVAMHRARAVQVQQERARALAEQQRRQASEQRLRIAQELHDVLGHHLSLINVQAGVGLHLMDSQPAQARAALSAIKQASAEALQEVRSVLAALHPAEESAPRSPAPRLAELADLTTDAGLTVRTSVVGQPRELPAQVDRAAYRIIQEALTNVRRHAGAGAAATVVIEYREEELVIQVEDDGGEAPAIAEPVTVGGGIGGMRERAAALGGELTAGPLAGGGFRVSARLPAPPEQAS